MSINISSRNVPPRRGVHVFPAIANPASRHMSMRTKLVIAAVLLGFAILHAVGTIRAVEGAHIIKTSDRPSAELDHMYRAD